MIQCKTNRALSLFCPGIFKQKCNKSISIWEGQTEVFRIEKSFQCWKETETSVKKRLMKRESKYTEEDQQKC